MRVAKHLRILGRVQAVGFRFFMEREARARGVTGWVRNRHDGSVEAVVQGSPEAVEEMIACARRGPRSAHVTEVRVSEHDGDYPDFTIRPTE
jgi:acylphosphatase